ncbi:hypothetical protein [Polluticoccus soli]|uniref:hypothetical protein n=1 Tax=Polluticoccus soli TaxID=3034150 RepID=UPI0023E2CB13|nr:hypothetical protein [Flavipsychrobacter sp. JY13-12]
MEHPRHNIPEHVHGAKKDLKHSYTAEDADDAEELFVVAKNKLLDVNNWDKTSVSASAVFQLADHHGNDLHRKAHKGDYIKINIPGPGSSTGGGFDWVHIEHITYDDYPDEHTESILMEVRPCPAPVNNNEEVAHFFKDDATSTFIIERHGKLLMAHYYGRNEVPNTEAHNTADVVRNAAVAAGALAGLSEMQWTNLIKGFLSFDE